MSWRRERPEASRGEKLPGLFLMPTLFLFALLTGCKEEIVPTVFMPSQAHEAYSLGLSQAGLTETALAADWIEAADQALKSPQMIELPFRESLFVDPSKSEAFGFRFATRRGQVIKIQIEEGENAELRLFIDVFRPENEKATPFVLIASADEHEHETQFEPRGDNEYILRVQPELLRGGLFTVSIASQPAFDFPVQGRTTSAILSPFGVSREAGRRSHHGVDIFAPRHTPVLAPSRAYVRRVGENDLGGNVVWLRDEQRSLSLYFAHLQEQKVEEGQWVEAGDIIGTVGNSGNARTTSTHLHFGIYRRGPVDPYYYVHSIRREPPAVVADTLLLGRWARPRSDGIRLIQAPTRRARILLELEPDTPLRIVGASAEYLKVQLPDGLIGYTLMRLLSPDPAPLSRLTLRRYSDLLSDPSIAAIQIGRVGVGSQVDVMGEFSDYLLIREMGRMAWVHLADVSPVGEEDEKEKDD